MGNGTLVDGVRRWFQRRSNNSSKLDDSHSNQFGQLSINSDFSASNDSNHQQDFNIQTDFDISGLKLIKVPKRIHFSRFLPPMDSHKKVSFYYFLY